MVCLIQLRYESLCLSCCILFCPVSLSSVAGLLFSEEEIEGKCIWRDEVGVELGGANRGEAVLGMDCMRNESNFKFFKREIPA